MAAAYPRSKIDFRCGTRMSFSDVSNPHMKNNVVTMASGRA
jgi:hypothetical protein